MKAILLVGTNRPDNLTTVAVTALSERLRVVGFLVEQVDSAALDLPFPGHPSTPSADAFKSAVIAADAIVLATPEYHGGYSAFLKLMIENLGFPSVLEGKPVALLGVAAGRIGAVKSLEQLRSVVSHVGSVVKPGALSIGGVHEAFSEDGAPDTATARQLEKFARSFFDFAATRSGVGVPSANHVETDR